MKKGECRQANLFFIGKKAEKILTFVTEIANKPKHKCH
ncbi:hypothetical protein BBD26_1297 [Lactobacillus delbrueckii subsp. bulgaricus]|nr:hypothetical protein BBD26_1297 [Lactobacillus delbrueckii subsp. bulgaricus]